MSIATLSSPPPTTSLALLCLLLGLLSLITDQIYGHFKFAGAPNGRSYCFYDNIFYGIYYRLSTSLFLVFGGLFFSPFIFGPRSYILILLQTALYFSFFAECEAIAAFLFSATEIEELLQRMPSDVPHLYSFLILGSLRWLASFAAIFKLRETIEERVKYDYGYVVPGWRMTSNRSVLSAYYGCVAQYFADYTVAHYLLYEALYGRTMYSPILDGSLYDDVDDFYKSQERALTGHKIAYTLTWSAAAYFYIVYVRKEITFFSFIA